MKGHCHEPHVPARQCAWLLTLARARGPSWSTFEDLTPGLRERVFIGPEDPSPSPASSYHLSSATVSDLGHSPGIKPITGWRLWRLGSCRDILVYPIGTCTPLLSPGLCSYGQPCQFFKPLDHTYTRTWETGSWVMDAAYYIVHSTMYVLQVYPIVGTGMCWTRRTCRCNSRRRPRIAASAPLAVPPSPPSSPRRTCYVRLQENGPGVYYDSALSRVQRSMSSWILAAITGQCRHTGYFSLP